ALHAPRDEAERVPDVLRHTLGVVDEREPHAGPLGDRVEEHRPGGVGALEVLPGDAAIGGLVRDLRVPLLLLARDLRAPVEPLVVELSHFLDAFHEAWKLFKLRPLVVDLAQGRLDVDRLFDFGHESSVVAGRSVGSWASSAAMYDRR